MVDAANFYTLSIFYPLLTRATYPRLGFPGYPGEVSTSDASDEVKEAARKSAEDALPRILDVTRRTGAPTGLHRRRRHADDR